jgi:hypothetical protein
MDTTRFRKTFAIISALFTGGLGISLVSLVPEATEATRVLN